MELQGKQTPILHNLTLNTCIWSNAFFIMFRSTLLDNLAWNANTVKVNFGMKKQ